MIRKAYEIFIPEQNFMTPNMNPKQSIRHTRKKTSWISAQNALQGITVLVILNIFLSEGWVNKKDYVTTRLKSTISSAVHLRPSSKTPQILRLNIFGKKEPLEEEVELRKNGSFSTKTSVDSLDIEVEGMAVDMAEFNKQAEQKALEDAIHKRDAIQMGKSKQISLLSTSLSKKVAMKNQNNFTTKSQEDEQHKHHRPHEEFRGVERNADNRHLFKVDNVTHLSFMLYRLVKAHNITSITDLPCTKSMFWMPEVLERLEFEVPNFHYRCIVPDDKHLVEGVLRFKDLSSALILKDSTAWASKLPKADLAFAWYAMGYMAPRRSWHLLKALLKSNTTYVVVPNYPEVNQNPGISSKHGRINVRRAPYRFSEPLRVVNNISSTPDVRKQMLFYTISDIRTEMS